MSASTGTRSGKLGRSGWGMSASAAAMDMVVGRLRPPSIGSFRRGLYAAQLLPGPTGFHAPLAIDARGGLGSRLQPFSRDGAAALLTRAVGALVTGAHRGLDPV